MNPFPILLGLVVVLVIVVLLIWFTQVQQSTIVVTYWFGAFNRVLQPGWAFIKSPVETSEVISTATRQLELPADIERIDRVSENPPPGMRKPYRVPNKGYAEANFYVSKEWYETRRGEPFLPNAASIDKLVEVRFPELPEEIQAGIKIDPINSAHNGEYTVSAEWSVKAEDEESVRAHVSNINVTEGLTRDEEIRKRLDDNVDSALSAILNRFTEGHVQLMRSLFSTLLQQELEKLVGEKEDLQHPDRMEKPWGIHIGLTKIARIYSGRTIAEAQAEASASVSEAQNVLRASEARAEATRNQAEADAFAAVQLADAQAYAALELGKANAAVTIAQAQADNVKEVEKGKGEAGRVREMADVAKTPEGQFAMAMDVVETTFPHCRPIIIAGGGSNNPSIGTAAAAVLSFGATLQEQINQPPPASNNAT